MYTHFLFSAVKIEKKRHNGLKECLTTFNPTWTLVLIKKISKNVKKNFTLFTFCPVAVPDRMGQDVKIPSHPVQW